MTLLSVAMTLLGVKADPPSMNLDCLATSSTFSSGFNIFSIFTISSNSPALVISVLIECFSADTNLPTMFNTYIFNKSSRFIINISKTDIYNTSY